MTSHADLLARRRLDPWSRTSGEIFDGACDEAGGAAWRRRAPRRAPEYILHERRENGGGASAALHPADTAQVASEIARSAAGLHGQAGLATCRRGRDLQRVGPRIYPHREIGVVKPRPFAERSSSGGWHEHADAKLFGDCSTRLPPFRCRLALLRGIASHVMR